MHYLGYFAALLLALGLAACANTNAAAVPLVRVHAASDLDCPDADIVIEEQLGGWFKAVGCGRKARYRAACQGVSCLVRGEDEGIIPSRDRPDPDDPVWR